MGTFIVRIVVGMLFIGHGLQKLVGAFGGPGLEKMAAGMEQMEMKPGKVNATAAGLSETVGGAAITVGAATPFASAALIATMLTAIRKVHWKNGIWNTNGGMEYNAVLISTVMALAERPGAVSIDAAFGKKRWGTKWAMFALIAGTIGSVAAVELGKRASTVDDLFAEDARSEGAATTESTSADSFSSEATAGEPASDEETTG